MTEKIDGQIQGEESQLDNIMAQMGVGENFRSGRIALVGRPNAGKSTLLNALLESDIAATSPRPQTTRENLLGIIQLQNEDGDWQGQLEVLDTPGLNFKRGLLDRRMHQEVEEALQDVDTLVWVADCRSILNDIHEMEMDKVSEDRVSAWLSQKLSQIDGPSKTWVLALTKVDLLAKNKLLPMIEKISHACPQFAHIVPVAALKGRKHVGSNLDALLGVLHDAAPLNQPSYDREEWTDTNERKLLRNLVLEAIFRQSRKEVPYNCDVSIEDFIAPVAPKTKSEVRANIWVSRKSLKPILVGQGGQRIKEIGTSARHRFKEVTGEDIVLKLFVKVVEKWERRPQKLDELGYGRKNA